MKKIKIIIVITETEIIKSKEVISCKIHNIF